MSDKKDQHIAFNTALIAVVSQVGLLTIALIGGALFAGLFLDNRFSTKPLFTLLFLIASGPIGIYLMIKIVRRATRGLQTVEKENQKES